MKDFRVCVIGSGISGLCSAKYLSESGINFTVFESTEYVGGLWRFDPKIINDDNGLPVHSTVYQSLRTNLASVAMELKGFSIPNDMPSFPGWEEYYNYIKSYAKHFDLMKYIKVLHRVTSVTKINNGWRVRYTYLPTKLMYEEDYDYIFIATGHFTKSNTPEYPGIFKGNSIHSRDYRESSIFKNRSVLVIGMGPSGMDIALEVAKVCRKLVHSHRGTEDITTDFPSHYILKPKVKEFTENGVVFVDGSFEEIDDVIYCTGYVYDFPFLDETCELTIGPRHILPLHRSIVNINHPSMMLIGITYRGCNVIAIDAQARYATALVRGDFTLPAKQKMMEELQINIDKLNAEKRPLSNLHFLGDVEDEYYAALTEESGIERVPPVMAKIRIYGQKLKFKNLYTAREYSYRILDKNTFLTIAPKHDEAGKRCSINRYIN